MADPATTAPASSKALDVATFQRDHPTFNVRVAPDGFGIVIERKDKDEEPSEW